jgi:cysteinyl-tRNA synthetase
VGVALGLVLAGALALSATGDDARPKASRSNIGQVTSWGYQLQGEGGKGIDFERLTRADVDLLVIDLFDLGEELTAKQLASLKRRPDGGRRIVLAYLSIGEAESYRYYWQKAWAKQPPGFLVAENSDWQGNFKVRYWDPAWRTILLGGNGGSGGSATGTADAGYLDRVLRAGFDGVYLDIVDAFEYFGPEGEVPERKTAAQDMAELVLAVARHARETRKRPDFLIVPQNGANIFAEISRALGEKYLAAVDAIGAEDTFYYGSRDENNPLRIQHDTVAALRRFGAAGKPVLAVDYVTDPAKAKKFVALARKNGFVPYVGRRALDRLVLQPK